MIRIYVTDSSPLCEELFFEQIYQNLNEERKKKADALKSKLKKRQSVAAGWLLDEAKKRQENNGEELFFNLSHSGELAVCAIADEAVGIDVELVGMTRERVIEKCFTESEKLRLMKEHERKDELFFEIWTKKESAAKLTREGIGRILRLRNEESNEGIYTKSFRLKREDGIYYLSVSAYSEKLPDSYSILKIDKVYDLDIKEAGI